MDLIFINLAASPSASPKKGTEVNQKKGVSFAELVGVCSKAALVIFHIPLRPM